MPSGELVTTTRRGDGTVEQMRVRLSGRYIGRQCLRDAPMWISVDAEGKVIGMRLGVALW